MSKTAYAVLDGTFLTCDEYGIFYGRSTQIGSQFEALHQLSDGRPGVTVMFKNGEHQEFYYDSSIYIDGFSLREGWIFFPIVDTSDLAVVIWND